MNAIFFSTETSITTRHLSYPGSRKGEDMREGMMCVPRFYKSGDGPSFGPQHPTTRDTPSAVSAYVPTYSAQLEQTFTMLWLGLLTMADAVAAQGFSTTMLRFGCSQVVVDRIDPYVHVSMISLQR